MSRLPKGEKIPTAVYKRSRTMQLEPITTLKKLTWANAVPKVGAIYILGHRGQGKSALAWSMADEYRKKKGFPSKVAGFCLPPDAIAAMPKWIEDVQTPMQISKLDKPHIIVLDESAFHVNSRRAMSEQNLDFTKLLSIIRHKGHLLIFISQTSRQIDIQLIEGFDLVLMKAPSVLQVRAARSELRPEIEKAHVLFVNMTGDTRKKVFMFDPHKGRTGMQPSRMPKWWTTRISKAYSSITF